MAVTSAKVYSFSNVSASFLKDHDLIGKQDPYLEFCHGKQKVKTPADKSAGQEARWNEVYTLEESIGQGATGEEAKVFAYNKNFGPLPDGALGAATFLLRPGRQTLTLYNKKNQETGTVTFDVSDGSGATTGRTEGALAGTQACMVTKKTGNMTDINASAGGVVCNQEYFTKVEDRPVTKEVKTVIKEHHPIEKQFVVETRPTGEEHELTDRAGTEVIDSKTTIVEKTRGNPCAGVPTN